MKLTKQQTQIVLGVLLAVLLVAFAVQFRGMLGGKPAPPPPAPAMSGNGKNGGAKAGNTAAAGALPGTENTDPGNMDWVPTELSRLVDMVAASRNPFQDLMPGYSVVAATPESQPNPPPPPAPKDPTLPVPPVFQGPGVMVPPSMPTTFSENVKLDWATSAELAAGLRAKDLGVTAKPMPGNPRYAIISGPSNMRDVAMAEVLRLNTPPPVPNFTLQGVIITSERPVAYVSCNGQGPYPVKEGQAVPHVGWTVVRITSTLVTLSDGRRYTNITLSGGGSR